MKSKEFIQQLVRSAGEKAGSRAELAALRRGNSGEARDLARVYPLVLPYAPNSREAQQAYVEVACLFGLYPTSPADYSRAISLAQALRRLREKSDSMESRFVALMQAHREELVEHLRHCVSLVKSHSVPMPLLWTDVLHALLWWDKERTGFPTQKRRWAQEYWGPHQTEDEQAKSANV